MKLAAIAIALVVLCTSSVLAQTTRHVPANFATIQSAIDAAVNGDTVLVQPGTYFERDITFRGKAITVRSAVGPSTTVIDAQFLSRVVVFNNGEGPASRLTGFALINGRVIGTFTPPPATYSIDGGGIYCFFASPTISDCAIGECRTGTVSATYGGNGGGLASVSGAPRLERCFFVNCNTGQGALATTGLPGGLGGQGGPGGSGGAVFAIGGQITIVDCSFSGCIAGVGGPADIAGQGGGGGAIALGAVTTLIEGCEFAFCRSGDGGLGNAFGGNAGPGGALLAYNSALVIRRSRFNNCRGGTGGTGSIHGAGGPGGAIALFLGSVTIEQSSFSDNLAGPGLLSALCFGTCTSFAGVPGGAVYASGVNLTVRDSSFLRNAASDSSPQFAALNASGGTGGAIYLDGGSLIVDRATFARNRAGVGPIPGSGGAIATGPVQQPWGSLFPAPQTAVVTVTSSIFWDDAPDEVAPASAFTITNSDVFGGFPGGNLDVDPRFVDLDEGDLHLLDDSPLIDAGGTVTSAALRRDIDGDPRVVFGAGDIGADEFILGPCRFGTAGASAIGNVDVLRIDGLGGSYSGYLRRSATSPFVLSLATPGIGANTLGSIIWGRIGIPLPNEGLAAFGLGFCVAPGFLVGQPDHFLLSDSFSTTSGALLGPLPDPGSIALPAPMVPVIVTIQGVTFDTSVPALLSTNALVIAFE